MKQPNTTRGGEHFDKIIFNDNNLFLLSVFSGVMLEGIFFNKRSCVHKAYVNRGRRTLKTFIYLFAYVCNLFACLMSIVPVTDS